MRFSGRSTTTIILIAAALVMAALVGLIIPMSSGSLAGRNMAPWTPPATATRPPRPTATVTLAPVATRQPTKSPAPATVQPTRPPATATAAVAARTTQTVTSSPTAAAQTPTPVSAPLAVVRQDPLSLRAQPNTGAALIALAQIGDTYTVTGRTADDAWLRICCVLNQPAWLAAAYVDVTGSIANIPIVQP